MDSIDEELPGVDPAQLRADMSLYGTAYVRARGDGTFERVDPAIVRRPIQPGEAFTDNVIAGIEQTDEQRGRAFLERLMSAEEEASVAIYDVLGRGIAVEKVLGLYCAALGRVLREST